MSAQAAETPQLTKAREDAVAEAQAGHLESGIQTLSQLRQMHMDDILITADLIVLMRRSGENAQIAELTKNTHPETLPDYVIMDWARALRDDKLFNRARKVLAGRIEILGLPAQILYAMVTLESGHPKTAIGALPDRYAPGLRAADLANMAYVWRRSGNPVKGLLLCEQALQQSPQNPEALHEEVFALADLGAANLALQKAQQNNSQFASDSLNRLRADATAIDIRDAIQERRRLDDLYYYQERNIPLNAALKSLEANRLTFAQGPVQELRTRYDQIYVLRTLKRMPQTITEFESLPQHPTTANVTTLGGIPTYVRRSAADAYLYLHHPKQAISLYEGLIAENPKAGVDLFIALYYAYLDGEQYDKAEQILTLIHKVTPVWRGAPGTVENRERLDVDQLWAMDATYRNHDAIAEARMRRLAEQAPYNTELLNSLATIERWRGWPAQSMQTTRMTATYTPKAKDTRLNIAENNQDMGYFNLWGGEIIALAQDFPTDTSIQKSLAQWNDRNSPSFSSEYTTGRSQGGGNPIAGTRDQESSTRLNSAWTEEGWRGFIDHQYIWADYADSTLSFNRLGAGAEWRGDRKDAWLMLDNNQLTGQHAGLSAGWSQWLDDQWQYILKGSTYSIETPLLAKDAGYSGKSVSDTINWRQSESRSAYASLELLSISDGNKRIDYSTGITQRLFATPYHITSGGIDVFAEHNSQPSNVYFNPANSEGASLRVEHQWITWRNYEQSFTQYYRIMSGYDWEAGYGGAPIFDLFYEHKWQLSRTWDIHYGIGWGSNVYDGAREYRSYGLMGLGGVF